MGKKIGKYKTMQHAVKIFTDRIKPRNAFWNVYEEYKKTMSNENPEAKVLSYYGMGGIGKSRLIEQLQEELESREKSHYVTLDFTEHNGMYDGLRYIQQVLKKKYHFSFPLYAAGLVKRAELEQKGEQIDENKFRSYLGETADDFFDMVEQLGWIPFIEFLPKTVRLFTKGINFLSKKRDKRLYKQEIREIQSKKGIPEIDKLLPVLLGKDIERNMASEQEPLVIFLDTYEKLVDELAAVGYAYTKDDWLKGDDGLILNTKKVLWVIAGREKLKWAEKDPDWGDSLEQHLMESISEADTREYLVAAGIPNMLQHDLYELTHGVPLLLDLSVDTYYRIQERGEEPVIDKFGHDEQTIVERYIRYMDTFQQKIMYKMAFLRKWPKNDMNMFKFEDGAFDPIQFNILAQSSCISEIDGMNVLHEVVGETLRKVCSPTLKEQLCRDLLAYFKERISVIEKETPGDVYLMTTAVAVALDYYLPEEIGNYLNDVIWPEINRLIEKMDRSLVDICEPIYEELSRRLGENHFYTLWAMDKLAMSYRQLGHYREAYKLSEKVFEMTKKVLGSQHLSTLSAMSHLATILSDLGRYQESYELREKVLEKSTLILGEDHPDTILAMHNLANSLSMLGRYQEALNLSKKILDTSERRFGERDPRTISAMFNLAISFSDLGRYQEAHELRKKVWELDVRILGEDHPNTIMAMFNLAVSMSNLGCYQEAFELNQKILEKRKNILGEEHPDTISSMINLACSLIDIGQYEEALKLNEEILEKCKRIFGDYHPETILVMNNLTINLKYLEKYQDSLEMQKVVVELDTRLLGEEHPDTILDMNNLANCMKDVGHYRDAFKLHKKVVELNMRILGEEHPDTIAALNNLAVDLTILGRYQIANKLQKKVVELSKRVLGETHPDTIIAVNNLHTHRTATIDRIHLNPED